MDKKALNLLILEDNPDNAELMVRELEKEGFKIEWKRVETKKALIKALEEKHDLILSDYKLPFFDSMAAIKLQRKIAPNIPLIIVSSSIGEELAIECLKAGATDYVLKDKLSRLSLVVKRALKEAEEHRERKKTEEALKKSEEQLRLITENTSDNIAITTFDMKATYIYVNPSVKSVLGYDAEDLLGKSFFDFIHPEDKKVLFPLLKKYVDQKIKKFLSGKEIPISETIEFRFKNKIGNWRFMQSTVNIAGKQILAVTRDITEHKQAEQTLKESEEKLSTILDSMPDIVLQLDTNLKILWANKATIKLNPQAVGQFCYKALPGRNTPCPNCPIIKVLKTGNIEQGIVHLKSVTGVGDSYWDDIGIPLKDTQRKITSIVKIARNITDSKKAENLLLAQHDLALKLNTTTELDEILNQCLDFAISISGMDCGGIYLVDEEKGSLELKNYKGLSTDFMKSSSYYVPDSQSTKLVMKGKPIYSQHKRLGVNLNDVREKENLKAIAIIPINFEGKVIACFNIASQTLDEVPIYSSNALETTAGQIGSVLSRVKVEKKLQESEEKYRTIFESIQDVYAEVAIDGTILEISPSILSFGGYTPEEVLGRSLSDFYVYPEQRAALIKRLHLDGKLNDYEVVLRHKTGRKVPCSFTVKVVTDNSGIPVKTVGTMRDITERKKAEEDLKESEQKFRDLANLLPQIVYEIDVYGNLTFVNKQAFESFGYSQEEYEKGFNVLQTLIPEDRDRAKENIQNILHGKDFGNPEYAALRKDGSTFPILIYSSAILKENKSVGLRGIIVDITERKQVEEELKKHREHLEELVKERTAELEEKNKELERYNKLFVGREFRIKELRDKIKEMEKQIKELNK